MRRHRYKVDRVEISIIDKIHLVAQRTRGRIAVPMNDGTAISSHGIDILSAGRYCDAKGVVKVGGIFQVDLVGQRHGGSAYETTPGRTV